MTARRKSRRAGASWRGLLKRRNGGPLGTSRGRDPRLNGKRPAHVAAGRPIFRPWQSEVFINAIRQ